MNSAALIVAAVGTEHNLSFVKSMLLRHLAVNPRTRAAAEALVARGAVLTLSDEPDQPHLVGAMRWDGETRAVFFIAFGDGPRDARLVRVDGVAEAADGSIVFGYEGDESAKLVEISAAGLDDPDDYRIAWQLWQQVCPLRRHLIERSFAAVAAMHFVAGGTIEPTPRGLPLATGPTRG